MIVAQPDPFIAAITAHVARDEDSQPLRFDGQLGSRARHEKSLKHYQRLVERLLNEFPRLDSESPGQWRTRVLSKSPRREDAGIIAMVGRLHAIIAKMDRDAAEEERRGQAEVEARREVELNSLLRAAKLDVAEIARLKRTVDAAGEGERLLAQLHAAFVAHRSAEGARQRMNALFDSARHARSMLRLDGEGVSTPLPK